MHGDMDGLCNIIISLAVPPEYTVNPSFTVIEGMNFTVDLGLIGNPFPTSFDWTFNGATLSPSGDIVLGLQLLDLGIANRTEAGNYSVTTSNVAGSGTGSFQVIVYCECDEL